MKQKELRFRSTKKVKNKKRTIVVLLSSSAILSISLLFYFGIVKYDYIPDSDRDLLHSYSAQLDISKFFSYDNEIMSVATRYSALYKDDIKREMFVFSLPIRNEESASYTFIDTQIHENMAIYSWHNKTSYGD